MPTYSVSTKVLCTLGRSAISGLLINGGETIADNVANLEDSGDGPVSRCLFSRRQSQASPDRLPVSTRPYAKRIRERT